jgi:hypothetical protein
MIAAAIADSAQAPGSSELCAAGIVALLSAEAVRTRCRIVHDWVAEGRSPHFVIEPKRLEAVADAVAQVTRAAYPDLRIPYHRRWRHFVVGGGDRWQELAAQLPADPLERARAAIDLATASVLLDAGAGAAWRYRDAPSGLTFGRSEGLAIASFAMFRAGAFSSDPQMPWRCDSEALQGIDTATLARHFQVKADNPLIGLDRRAALLRRLGAALAARPDLFGQACPRPGHLVDHVLAKSGGRVRAAKILCMLLDGLSSIWPSGMVLGGIPIGDAGRHPAVRTGDETDGIVPFHKLSQWLTYSLLEPIEAAGVEVVEIDALTALPEYRNGGLLIDHGVIRPRTPIDPVKAFEVGSELIVEWRALTVTLMDQLLMPVRDRLGLGDAFKLPHLLQGGTWSAGRKVARTLRPPDGPPPIAVAADGTVF